MSLLHLRDFPSPSAVCTKGEEDEEKIEKFIEMYSINDKRNENGKVLFHYYFRHG